MESATKKPAKVFFCDSVTATLWITPRLRGDRVMEVPTVKFDKSFEVDGERKYTASFYDQDLPKVALLAMEVYRFLKVRSVEPPGSEGEAGNDGSAREKATG